MIWGVGGTPQDEFGSKKHAKSIELDAVNISWKSELHTFKNKKVRSVLANQFFSGISGLFLAPNLRITVTCCQMQYNKVGA